MADLRPLTVSDAWAAQQCKRRLWGRLHSVGLENQYERQLRAKKRRRLLGAAIAHLGSDAIPEYSFENEYLSVTVDALRGTHMYAVRGSATLKRHHIDKLGLQWAMLKRIGANIDQCTLVHVNPSHQPNGPEPLFVLVDVTEAVEAKAAAYDLNVEHLHALFTETRPFGEQGPHCHRPFVCPQFHDCHPPREGHPLSEFFRVKARVIERLARREIEDIADVPPDFPLPPIAARQREAIASGALVVEPSIGLELDRIVPPVAFIDFEAIQPTIPPWPNCRPFSNVAVQVSVHFVDNKGVVTHHEWIPESSGDPRRNLAAFIAPIVGKAKTLVAYYAPFEQGILRDLANFSSPHHGDVLRDAANRFVDLLPLIRDHVYHPRFHGRFNLKTVVSALLPSLAYDDLIVKRGDVASLLLEDFISLEGLGDAESRQATKEHLLAYCKRDTLTLLRLVEFLRAKFDDG